jgi:uncharacterized Zn finger protein
MDESRVRDHTSPESFRRGEDYYLQGTVLSMTRRGGALQAEVAGSDFAPYNVRVSFDETGVTDATCSCPYEWGGWCKHIVAVLLAQTRDPEEIRNLPALEETLSELDRGRLQELLLKLAERDPSLAGVIESELSLSASHEARPVNPEAIRRRIRAGINDMDYGYYDDYWSPTGDLDEARRVLDGAWDFIRAVDGRNALAVLEAITEEYMEACRTLDWEMIGDYGGELMEFFEEVGIALTEALLLVDDLAPREREDWWAKLDVWLGELRDYVAGDAFGAAFRAVEQGWFYPPLVRVLEGELPDDEFFEELLDDPLTIARLNVLERRRGYHEEYLRLSEAADETTSHAVMLARLGRTEEAVEYGLKRLATPEEAFTVAEALREKGAPEAALLVGERGLSLEGHKGRLAVWVRDLAEGIGRRDLALQAAVAAFHANQDLSSYRRTQELVGGRWPECREQLLDHLRRNASYYPSGPVDIFLHEDLIGDAISAVDRSPVEALVARVADAAIESYPDWVVETCRKKAEEIMDGGRSKYYEDAISWLEKAREAYLTSGREEEWLDYLDGLIERHQRKYKLRPMLEDLDER